MACGTTIVRLVLFIGSGLFVVVGVLLIIYGALGMMDINSLQEIGPSLWQTRWLQISIIVIGAAVTVISWIGCCGALRESALALQMYATLVALLFIVEVFITIYIWKNRAQFENELQSDLKNKLHMYSSEHNGDPPSAVATRAINEMQRAWKCCGVNSPQDYDGAMGRPSPDVFPASCCGETGDSWTCIQASQMPGCFTVIKQWISSQGLQIGILSAILLLCHLVVITFACCLATAYDRAASYRL